MPKLQWDVYDVISCFEVLPVVEEYETEHIFQVIENHLVWTFIIWQYESIMNIQCAYNGTSASIFTIAIAIRNGISLLKKEQYEYLVLKECILLPSRWYRGDLGINPFDTMTFPQGITIEIYRKPWISIHYLSRLVGLSA